MKKLFLNFLLIFSLSALSQNVRNVDYIEVSGEAKMEIVPNEFFVKIILNEKDYKNKTFSAVEKEMISALKKAGVDVNKDLKIKDLSSEFKKMIFKKEAVLIKEFQLKISSAETLVKAFKALDGAGVSRLSLEKIDHSEREKLQLDLKASAMKNAREKAAVMASAVGQEIGRAIYISEGFVAPFRAEKSVAFLARNADSAEEIEPNLEFENIVLQSKVSVYFELK